MIIICLPQHAFCQLVQAGLFGSNKKSYLLGIQPTPILRAGDKLPTQPSEAKNLPCPAPPGLSPQAVKALANCAWSYPTHPQSLVVAGNVLITYHLGIQPTPIRRAGDKLPTQPCRAFSAEKSTLLCTTRPEPQSRQGRS